MTTYRTYCWKCKQEREMLGVVEIRKNFVKGVCAYCGVKLYSINKQGRAK